MGALLCVGDAKIIKIKMKSCKRSERSFNNFLNFIIILTKKNVFLWSSANDEQQRTEIVLNYLLDNKPQSRQNKSAVETAQISPSHTTINCFKSNLEMEYEADRCH